ncbi:hypothetical protein C3432_18510 [Citrobacter amalonaticus]|uniref:Uncharacterized protein n=1 Tax=Citrobacter amalonaticus TaxID=35703 RepID=A0A2S4RX82_CITAM|nr:hypothetical protein C3432_18510 [Citrobacter amalonaticus]POT74291.1 hypothetical protein C3436_16150 [Citrobacter amalonaticus]POU65092.1 hypothetical protein C3430_12890 [Citrobacter amalonaticus]POV03926.1 hypothetical protein C3424_17830 [Citrobacter amalonaticus]
MVQKPITDSNKHKPRILNGVRFHITHVILQAASVLALLLGPSSGPLQAAFKSAPGRFVAHPSHIVIYAAGDSLACRLPATRII